AKGFDVRINIVGFAVDDEALKSTFKDWAKLGGGAYFDAGNAAELDKAVRSAVAPTFRVQDSTGAVVASGIVGGPALTLPAGTYNVEIGTTGAGSVADVVVLPGQPTLVDYAPP
ncbi:MAG: hypothetical protein ABIO62_15985, partial [Paracoccaceae bacterium]